MDTQASFRTFIFDFDGTIADTYAVAFAAANKVAHAAGVRTAGAGEQEAMRSLPLKQILRTFHIPWYRVPELLFRVRAELGNHIETTPLIPGIDPVVNELAGRGIVLGLLTANSEENVRHFLSRHGIDGFRFGSFSSGLWSKGKKLRALVRAQSIDPSTAVYIGDTPEDVAAGRKAGVAPVAVSWGYASVERLKAAALLVDGYCNGGKTPRNRGRSSLTA